MHAYSLQSQDRIDVDVAEFISQAALKNQEAFGKLDTIFRGRVSGLLVRACGDHWLADELTNATFMRAYESLSSYKGSNQRQFQSFLFTIATNLLRDKLRRRPWPGSLPEEKACQLPSESNNDECPEAKERQAMLREAISGLSADEAMLISLAHLEDLPAEEIAKVLGKPSGQAVRAALCRAMKHLREILCHQGYFTQVVS